MKYNNDVSNSFGDELKKQFPFTQLFQNRYLQQNRLQHIKDDLTNIQQQTISIQIKDLLHKDKTRSRKHIDEITQQQTTPRRLRSKERTISVNKKSPQAISYHDSQNVNLHNKSIRRDVVQLAQWLEVMLQQVQLNQSTLSYQEYYNKIEVLFTGSILELQRLMQQKGFEFGQFLRKTWDQFVVCVSYSIEGLANKANLVEQQSLDQINKLHIQYQEAMQKQVIQLNQLKEEILQLQQNNIKLIKENLYHKKKDVRREKQLRELIYDKDHYTIELIDLRTQQEFLNKQNDQQYHEKLYDYFRKQCENHLKSLDLQYKNFQIQDQYFDQTLDVQLKEKSSQVIDLIKYVDSSTTTGENQFVSVSTQTHKQKKKVDEEIQVQINTTDQETQVALYQIKRDKLVRNAYEQMIFSNSKLDLEDIVEQFSQFYFPLQELKQQDPIYLNLINQQIILQQKQINQLLDTINMRNDITPKDFVQFKQYIQQVQDNNLKNYTQIWNIVLHQQSQVIDAIIEKQDVQVELNEFRQIFINNMQIVKKFQQKYEEEQKIQHFYSSSIARIIKYAPQNIINQIQAQANQYNVLKDVEFKELRKKNTIIDSRISVSPREESTSISKQQQSPVRNSTQINSMKQIQLNSLTNSRWLKAQKSFEIEVDKELQDIDEESYESNDQDMTANLSMLKFDFQPERPQLTFEKKLRITTCPVKSAQQATTVLKQIMKKFNRNNMKGLYTLNTLLQNYTELLQRNLPNNQNTPLHVHLYEFITFRYGQSQLSDTNRYKRMIKSFLYYEHRHATCKMVVRYLKADLDVQDFNTYLQILEICNEYPTISFHNFIKAITEFLTRNHYETSEIESIVNELYQSDIGFLKGNPSPTEFDLIMDQFITIFGKYKNRTSKIYKYLFEAVDSCKGAISFQQWNFLYETIVQSNFTFSWKLFNQEADYHDSQLLMSRQRFTIVSDELQIFQPEQQAVLLDNQSFEEIYQEMQHKWVSSKVTMKICFIKASSYDQFIKSLFSNVDRALNTNTLIEQACIIYKLLSKTYKQYYLNSLLSDLIPIQIQQISTKFIDIMTR